MRIMILYSLNCYIDIFQFLLLFLVLPSTVSQKPCVLVRVYGEAAASGVLCHEYHYILVLITQSETYFCTK